MKKIIKVIGTAALLIIGLVKKAALTPAVPNNYTKKTETGGRIEAAYLSAGDHKVKAITIRTDEVFKEYVIYYPEDLVHSDKKYPLVIFVNGTGIKGSKYKALFKHLASWGFIVAGNEDESSGTGLSTDKTLSYLLNENEDPESIFFQKIDVDNIGLSGHSQGGAGVLSAITINEHGESYKAAVALSPVHEKLAHGLGWNYELEKIGIPVLLLAGTKGDFEMNMVIPRDEMITMYGKINSPKVMARRLGTEHRDMLYQSDGYVTAWLLWYLQDDQEAAKAFTGDKPELIYNELYQEQAADLD